MKLTPQTARLIGVVLALIGIALAILVIALIRS